jgi:hypothetical protein
MSANAELLRGSEDLRSPTMETVPLEDDGICAPQRWCREDFAREQIRSLVRRVFFTSIGRAVKQVVFSAAEPHLDVATICDEVALALARETRGHVALVASGHRMAETACARAARRPALIKSSSTQLAANLWRVQKSGLECSEESGTGPRWAGCLEELGKEFEYVVIQAAPAGISSEAVLLGQLTDGIILVLDARRTRRATARKIKETMDAAQCRMLGTVLMERTFPIPEGIYRRL